MSALDTIASVFPPERGAFWLAAGVRFTSFVFVESIAVLSLEIGDTVEMNLLGLSRMSLPRRDLTLAQLELALRARFSSRDMVVSVQAQLTDNSWLLSAVNKCALAGSLRKLRKQGAGAQFSFPAAIDAVPPCGCSSIFNAASRPLRRLAAALALQRMRPEEMNLTSVDPSGFGTRMRVASSTSTAPFMVP